MKVSAVKNYYSGLWRRLSMKAVCMDYEEDCKNEDSVHVSKRYRVVVLAGVHWIF